MPEIRKFRQAVTQSKEVVVIMKIIGGDFFTLLNSLHCSTRELKIVSCKANCVGSTGVVDDGGDREESLNINIFVGILADDISIGIYNTCKIISTWLAFRMQRYPSHAGFLSL